jgi:tetratricopeptide (TPR) repeat protein
MKTDRDREAIEHLKKVVTEDPKHFAAWKNLGICYAHEDQHPLAWQAMQRALALNPDDGPAATYAAAYLKKLGRTNEIAALYQKAHAAGAEAPAISRYLALKAAKEGNDELAIQHYRKALELDPAAETYFNLGLACRRLKRWDEAAEAYERATRLDGTFAKAWLNLGYVRMNQDRLSEARQAFEKALQCDPKYDNALDALKELKAKEGAQLATHAPNSP